MRGRLSAWDRPFDVDGLGVRILNTGRSSPLEIEQGAVRGTNYTERGCLILVLISFDVLRRMDPRVFVHQYRNAGAGIVALIQV